MLVTANYAASVVPEKSKFTDQVKRRLISQFINGVLRVLQEIMKYFNSTTISTSLVLQ